MSPQAVDADIADATTELQDHTHYAGRGVAGVTKPITLAKKGIRQVRSRHEHRFVSAKLSLSYDCT
jgi:hypothetical protein